MIEKARALAQSRGFGVLATVSKKKSGFPFASLTPYALDAEGRPIFLISQLAVHTKNLQEDPNASLFIFDPGAEQDPLTAPRMNLMGEVRPVPDSELDAARAAYLNRHPEAAQLLGFGDFGLYRLQIADTYFIGGFGEMGWLP
jgi:heme iron utilization protein